LAFLPKLHHQSGQFRGIAMKWFRIHHYLFESTPFKRLSLSERAAYLHLYYLASRSDCRGIVTSPDDDIAYELGMDESDWLTLKAKFKVQGFLDFVEGGFSISSWGKDQYPENPYGRPSAHKWREIRTVVFARDNYTCQYCGAYGVSLQCDHSIPISRGGSNDFSNLVAACCKCNQRKHNKTPQEWLGSKA
jgi:HNH endonuclease